MKKICIVGLIFILLSTTSCGGYDRIDVYFINSENHQWTAETRKIKKAEEKHISEIQKGMIGSALNELFAGPKSGSLAPSIPFPEIIKKVILVNNETAEVYFDESYGAVSDFEAMICRGSLVWTLTELDFITNLRFFVGDEELLLANNQPMGLCNRENVLIGIDLAVVVDEEKEIVLYFIDGSGTRLAAESRVIEVDSNEPIEKFIIEELIKGTEAYGLTNAVPSDAGVRNVSTDESLCCYVNFTANFFGRYESGSAAEQLAVYSIVNSLTDPANNTNIKRVQILIEGDKITEAGEGAIDFSRPIERDESLISAAGG